MRWPPLENFVACDQKPGLGSFMNSAIVFAGSGSLWNQEPKPFDEREGWLLLPAQPPNAAASRAAVKHGKATSPNHGRLEHKSNFTGIPLPNDESNQIGAAECRKKTVGRTE
jgi:hypothetical protein